MKTFEPFTDVQTEQLQCLVAEDHAEILRPRLDDLEWPEFEIVKESTVRTVSRGTIEGVRVYRKLFRAVTLSDRARDALSGSRGMRELMRLDQARERGIPAVRPLAAGRILGSFGSRSFLITAAVEADPMQRSGWHWRDASAAGHLLRLAHDRGLHSADLHPGNLLLDHDREQPVLCDLTSALFASPLEHEQRARGLAYFCLGLDGLVRDREAEPLLSAYEASPSLVADAHRRALRLRNRALSAFGRRSLRACRHTILREENPPRRARWFLHRAATDLHDAAIGWLEQDDLPPPVKSGRRGSVHVAGDLVVKQRSAAAARELFRAAYWLEFADVPTPAPVGLRLAGGTGHVFTRRLPWPDLAQAFEQLDDHQRLAAARSLGRSMARLHGLGLRNRDGKFENLIVDPENGTTYLVDLDGIQRRKPIETRGRARDLGRILAAYRVACSDTTDARVLRAFLLHYTRATKCLGLQIKLRHLLRHTAARASEWASAHPNTAAS